MTERSEINPVSQDVINHILSLESREVSFQDEGLRAVHVTSIELFQKMIQSGFLVDRSSYVDAYSGNQLSLIPTRRLIPKLIHTAVNAEIRRFLDPEEARSQSELMGESIAPATYFLTQLQLPLDDRDLTIKAYTYLEESNLNNQIADRILGKSTSQIIRQEMRALADLLPHIPSDSLESIPRLAKNARERKGFLTGIKTVHPSQIKSTEYLLNVSFGPQGMPYRAITAIEPLGVHERNFLNNLRK